MIKSKNTILVTIQNLKKDNYDPPMELQRTLRSIGALAEIVTPYNDLSIHSRFKVTCWNFITCLSKINGFSILIPILFFLKGLEIYRQVKIQWMDFDRILVYDLISYFSARKASKDQIPIIFHTHYGCDPYLAYLHQYGVQKRRLGYILMQKFIIALFNQPIHKLLSSS